DEVNAQTSINAWVDWDGDPGAYLCEYIAYLGMWYQSMHSSDADPVQCRASGFVHVDNTLPLEECRKATNITIRETIKSIIPQPAYDINVTTGWNFISFPLDISGSVDVLFNDSINGDGNTTWDFIQWYDASDPADHWKTYSIFRPSILNDMPDVNNTMGVWINITSNGGDGMLTVGITGLWPTSSVSVPLYVGWNMIGYAAQNDSAYTVWNLKNDTGATGVEGFGAGPYNLQILDDSYILKKGEAYWVWIDSPTTWTIDW
ncbi:MAG: hypothetical protein KAS67_00005, partial [Thermoplasmata archaeon]|nr:hypothetical protein [Thermoplasmata archaeon]